MSSKLQNFQFSLSILKKLTFSPDLPELPTLDPYKDAKPNPEDKFSTHSLKQASPEKNWVHF